MRNITLSAATLEKKAAFFEAVKVAEEKRANGEAYAGKGEAMDLAKQSATALNKSIIADAVKDFAAFAETDKAAFFNQYMTDWTVSGYGVTVETEQSVPVKVASVEKALRVPFSAIDSVSKSKITTRGDWQIMAQVFINNCLLAWAAEGGVDMKPLPNAIAEKRATLGDKWVNKSGNPLTSNTALTKEL